jgi:glycosyltransferase involved in cell wall biosynthesis
MSAASTDELMAPEARPATRPLRVLWVLVSFHPGGAERQTIELIRRIDRTRYEPVVAVLQDEGPLRSRLPEDVRVIDVGLLMKQSSIPRWLSRLPGCGRLARWLVFSHLLKREAIDVAYNRVYNLTLDLAWPAWWRGIPRISVCVADQLAEIHRYARIHPWLSWHFARWSYRTADIVAANSRELREQVAAQLQLPLQKIEVLVNGFDIGELETLSNEPIAALSMATSSSVRPHWNILTIGWLNEGKGYLDLVAALDKVAKTHAGWEIEWHIIGTGPLAEPLRELARDFPANLSLRLWGAIPNPFPFYRLADLFVLPSHSEGSPNVLVEAMAIGCPVISTNCPCGPREILQEGEFGQLVDVGQPAQLRDAITAFVASPDELRQKAVRAKSHVVDHYNIHTTTRRLEALFDRISPR